MVTGKQKVTNQATLATTEWTYITNDVISTDATFTSNKITEKLTSLTPDKKTNSGAFRSNEQWSIMKTILICVSIPFLK